MTAHEYRSTRGLPLAEGYVILGPDDAEPCGWTLALDRPRDFRPGAVALDATGKRWRATGGNADEGAARWVPVA
jgi:hypothetical protein